MTQTWATAVVDLAAAPDRLSVHAETPPKVTLAVFAGGAVIEVAWRAFETVAARTPFQSFDWLARWQRHVGDRRQVTPAIVVGRDDRGELQFIFPFAIEKHGPVRCLTWLGSALCDYNAQLVAPAFAAGLTPDSFRALWRDMLVRLRADRRFRFDYVDMQKMPETIGGIANPLLALPLREHPSGAHAATLSGDWETFYEARRSSSTRKTDRKKRRRLAERGEIRFTEPVGDDERQRTLSALFRQKANTFSRQGVGNFLASPGVEEFYRDVVGDPETADLVHLSRLDVGPEIAAISVGLQGNDAYHLVLSSYHDGALAQHGPGMHHLHELLRRAIDKGLRVFDFTVGDEAYKHDWCDIEIRLYDHLAPATPLGVPAVAAIVAYRNLKRFIKQTPILWSAFYSARSLLLRRRFTAKSET